MWKLRNIKKEHWEQYIFFGEECIVGRKEAAVLITNDPSVSRKHAIIFVRHPEENLGYPSKSSSLFLRDEGSKYGTFKNGVRITNVDELADGDVIKFGQFESEFRVHYVPLVVTTSCLDVTSKNKLKQSIRLLGGHVVSEWQPACTHLVMSQVKITIKALCCLVSLKHIVLPDYFEELVKTLKSSSTIVSPNEFIPPIGESLIDKDKVSFGVNLQRRNIFKHKSFFFMDEKQFKKLHLGIIMGGGTASILSENKADTDLLFHDNTCFIEPVKGQIVKEESKNFLKEIISALQKKNLRMIPESDIGLAVAYASTDTFCNPSFNIGSAVLGSEKITSQTLSEREVYVPDSLERKERPSSSKRSSFLNLENVPKSKKQRLEAPDSLNLTTLKEVNEDILEIPLSAQVKQELDDIFESTMKADNEQETDEIEELPSTLPLEVDTPNRSTSEPKSGKEKSRYLPEQASPVKPKIEINTSIVNGQAPSVSASSIRPKVERNTSIQNGNRFDFATVNADKEENLPSNLMKVQFVSLIVRKPVVMIDQPSGNSQVKNFKKFKKVLPKKAQALPRIIGGHDLIPYDKDAAKLTENWDDDIEVKNNQPIKGAFDWDTNG